MVQMSSAPTEMRGLLLCATPDAWLERAVAERNTLLIDHANCEKKAAGTALSLLYRYVDRSPLLTVLSPIAREELLHFEQVLALMRDHDVVYRHLSPSRYARGLKSCVRTHEPARLIDTLLVAAVVEARSCERFACLAQILDGEIGRYYGRLREAEARHRDEYLALANEYDDGSADVRLTKILERDRELVSTPDPDFRFHSGVPL